MLFFFDTTANKVCWSQNRVVPFLSVFLFICCILPSISNAYPLHSSFLSITNDNNNNNNNNNDNNYVQNPDLIMLNENTAGDEDKHLDLERDERATGFYIIRNGDYLTFIPDTKHNLKSNMRIYIGRRR
ncbi:unnamed protein product [Rotaria magnacalcarata]|uniref:Uncharacterized protein n=1 Tax=Rotaria magnacalcarata TaxID=392030 RepID=A0A8S3C4Z8_9BILA|nr:unnamed protein product [Rotaria magnacalcarata]